MQLVLGTMTWGYSSQTDESAALEQIQHVASYDPAQDVILDTARIYQFGQTEEVIGKLLPKLSTELRQRVKIHTKAHPMISSFTYDGLNEQLSKSLAALSLDTVDVFYLHQPDIKVPLEETLKACNQLFSQGKFKELGLSNYAAWDVVRAYYICKENGYVLPTVYQGCYNLLSRSIVPELLPAVRACNMRCYVYNPLAGGFLTGKYASVKDTPKSGRFSAEFDFIPAEMQSAFKGKGHLFYRKRYFNDLMLQAVKVLQENVPEGKSLIWFSLNWLKHSSWLNAAQGDGIIIGASKAAQCKENVSVLKGDQELDDKCVEAAEAAWFISKPVSEPYLRGYGKLPGSSEDFLAKF